MHKVQHDKRAQLQPSVQDSPSETAPVTPAPARRDWAIFTRPAGATTNEPRTTRNGGGRNDTRINTERPMTRHAPDDSENDRADPRKAWDRQRVKEMLGKVNNLKIFF